MAINLKTIDPAEAWKPAPADQWNLKWAAHLYRRAAFGFPPRSFFTADTAWQALLAAAEQPADASIERLLTGGPGQAEFDELMDEIGTHIAHKNPDLDGIQGWWLYRILHTSHPLLERTTLFWHNHFATSAAKVRKLPLMMMQNQLLRQHALGSFRPMLRGIGRDPAMLIWLDSNSNVKGKPNENYAREVMELFSLGEGNYTEQDIREAARAFTGWGTANGEFRFVTAQHDTGSKTVLGKSGDFDGDDIANILLDQDAAARFLVRKLFREFISENESPPDRLLEPLAAQLRKSDYNVGSCLRTMLRSQLFFSEAAYRQRIKSPVEFVVGMLTAFDATDQGISMNLLADSMDGLGQALFAPPNVKGWDGGRTWLNSATLLARHNLAWRFFGGKDQQVSIHPGSVVAKLGKKTSEQQIDLLLRLLLQDDTSDAARDKLLAFAKSNGKKEDETSSLLRQLTHTVLLMPEYQLA